MDLNAQKGLCVALLIIDTLIFGWIPYFFVGRGQNNPQHAHIRSIVISHFNSFAGGVFLGVCLLGILVEGREVMEEYMEESGTTTEIPIYETLIACGFFLIATAEKIAHLLMHRTQAVKKSQATELSRVVAEVNSQLAGSGDKISATIENGGTSGALGNHSQGVDDGHVFSTHLQCRPMERSDFRACRTCATQTIESEKYDNSDPHDHIEASVRSIAEADTLSAFLLLSAFSFHTVFDGLAVGLQETDEDIWKMFAGVCTHKSLVSLCLGLQFFLVYKDRPMWAFFWLFFLSLVAPIGIGAGIAILNGSMDNVARSLTSGILQGVACGTFLYVTCFEILHPELIEKPGFLRMFLALVGFATMLAIMSIEW